MYEDIERMLRLLEEVRDLQRELRSMVLIEHAEQEALVNLLVASGVLQREQFETARAEARQAAQAAVAEILRTGGSSFDDLLRKFQGPVQ